MISSKISDKVLTIGPDPAGKGGMATVVRHYRDWLFSKWNFIAEARVEGGKLSKLYDAFGACLKLMSILWSNKSIRIIHIHTAGKVSFPRSCIFMRIAKLMRRKVVLHIHSGAFSKYCEGREKKVGKALRSADAIIVLGETWIKFYRETFGLTNLFVVPNIVQDVSVSRDILQRSTQDRIHALFLGQLVERKGIYDLLEALSLERNRLHNKFVLHIGGNGDVDRLRSEISRLGLDGMVVFEGWVSADKKRDLLTKSSISILPSYFEGLPISLLEGMSYGHALIATNVGSIPEILDVSNGIIFNPGDKYAISDAIVNLVNNPKVMREMGEASKKKVEPYLPDKVGDSLTEIYENLINS